MVIQISVRNKAPAQQYETQGLKSQKFGFQSSRSFRQSNQNQCFLGFTLPTVISDKENASFSEKLNKMVRNPDTDVQSTRKRFKPTPVLENDYGQINVDQVDASHLSPCSDHTIPSSPRRIPVSDEILPRDDRSLYTSDDSDDSDIDEIYTHETVQQEIEDFYREFPCQDRYRILDKIGEGTFSSVYRAIDWHHYRYDNSAWCNGHLDLASRRSILSKSAVNGVETQKWLSAIRKSHCGIVALKRIYATSSPNRIWNEIAILHVLKGHKNVAALITAFRQRDHIIVVLEVDEIQDYMRALLRGLAHMHEKQLIHRDVKPSNFLYRRSARTGILVDFGLAQAEEPLSQKENKEPRKSLKTTPKLASMVSQETGAKISGYLLNEHRPNVRANRAGTRGFRAPEVLFKVVHQTRALDVWSAGVILLCIFTGKFPFFQSNDDQEALMEISHIFGREHMKQLAALFNRTFDTNLPSIQEKIPFSDIVSRLNPNLSGKLPQDAFDLLSRLLECDPQARITAKASLEHPFLMESSN